MVLMVLGKCDIGTFTSVRHSIFFLFCSSISDKVLVFSSISMNMQISYFAYWMQIRLKSRAEVFLNNSRLTM